MSGLRVPGFTIKKNATRLRRGSLDGSVGSNKSSGREDKEILASKTEDDFVEQAYREHMAKQLDEMGSADRGEVERSRKASRKQALQLSKASTQIVEAIRTAQDLSRLVNSRLYTSTTSQTCRMQHRRRGDSNFQVWLQRYVNETAPR